jgi:hypothetical protein
MCSLSLPSTIVWLLLGIIDAIVDYIMGKKENPNRILEGTINSVCQYISPRGWKHNLTGVSTSSYVTYVVGGECDTSITERGIARELARGGGFNETS